MDTEKFTWPNLSIKNYTPSNTSITPSKKNNTSSKRQSVTKASTIQTSSSWSSILRIQSKKTTWRLSWNTVQERTSLNVYWMTKSSWIHWVSKGSSKSWNRLPMDSFTCIQRISSTETSSLVTFSWRKTTCRKLGIWEVPKTRKIQWKLWTKKVLWFIWRLKSVMMNTNRMITLPKLTFGLWESLPWSYFLKEGVQLSLTFIVQPQCKMGFLLRPFWMRLKTNLSDNSCETCWPRIPRKGRHQSKFLMHFKRWSQRFQSVQNKSWFSKTDSKSIHKKP